jgi:hypothetical protein
MTGLPQPQISPKTTSPESGSDDPEAGEKIRTKSITIEISFVNWQ